MTCVPLLESLQAKQFLVWERLGAGLYVSDRSAPLSKFSIDWRSIDIRRGAELAKLQAVQRYAYTKECRRRFVLQYFGDPAARGACAGCDNCLGISAAPLADQRLAKPTRAKKLRRSREEADARNDDLQLGDDEQRLLGALKALRTSIAREEHVPPYIVFSDRTLAELAVRRPRSLSAFGNVRGVGPMKIERYGQRFLEAISQANEFEAA
jgi:ATP-dependent DNA helicase RecQ